MSDLKISQLGPFSETDVVASDVLPLADVSAQQTKKIAASDLVKAGARLNADTITFGNNVVVTGNFTVNGTTTTIDTTTLRVEDKNIEMGVVATPTDVTANGGGITLKGTTDKTINWLDATDSWTSSENVDLASGKSYRINNTEVLNSTTLGSGVTSSSLTSVGTVTTGTWQGTTVATGYGGTGQTTYSNGQLLIGKTDGTLAKSTITAGSGVTVTNGDGAITIAATGSGGTVTNVTGTAPISVANGTTTPSISIAAASTSAAGAVQLTDSTSSTSTTTAATPNAVKSAYDLADAALPEAGGTMTGALGVTAGTAAAPGVFFSGDTNTGIYSPGADQVAISTGGSGRLFVDSSGKVGVGTSTPSSTSGGVDISSGGIGLVVGADGNASARTNATDKIFRIGSAHYTNAEEPVCIAFGQNLSSDNELNFGGGSAALNAATYMRFFTAANNTTTGGTERMRLDSSGRLGIGTSSPTGLLTVAAASPVIDWTNSSNTAYKHSIESTGYSASAAGNTLAFKVASGSGTQATVMTLDGSGRVGIGTTSPSTSLHVSNASNAEIRLGSGSYDAYIGQDSAGVLAISQAQAGSIKLQTNGSERARIDSSGRLLVGTSSSSNVNIATFQGNSSLSTGTGIVNIALGNTSPGTTDQLGRLQFTDSGHNSAAEIIGQRDGGTWNTSASRPTRLVFSTTADGASSPTERMRISSAGHIIFVKTSTSTTTRGSYIDGVVGTFVSAQPDAGSSAAFYATSTGNLIGSISHTTTATSYATSSDYRLKENTEPVVDGILRLQQLKPSRFNFIADPSKTVDGFIAHEVQAVVPEAVTGQKDAVDADGKPVYQGIDQSKLVPLLTAALQEAVAKIESLEARLTAAGI